MFNLKNLSGEKLILFAIGGFTLLVLLVIVIFAVNEGKGSVSSQTANFAKSDSDRPKATADSSFRDLGKMNVNDEKAAEFSIKNDGTKPLTLFKLSTSCDCTFAKLDINGQISPEFTMHSKSDWKTELPPGDTAKLVVTYRPFIMPVKGIVSRQASLATNDPDNETLIFTINATVE